MFLTEMLCTRLRKKQLVSNRKLSLMVKPRNLTLITFDTDLARSIELYSSLLSVQILEISESMVQNDS